MPWSKIRKRMEFKMIIETGVIPRVAFSIFGVDIYWYAIIITTAILIRIYMGKSSRWKVWYKI